MNVHVSTQLKLEWPGYEFIGKPFIRNGKNYIRAKSKFFGHTHFYCFEEKFFWFDFPDINDNVST